MKLPFYHEKKYIHTHIYIYIYIYLNGTGHHTNDIPKCYIHNSIEAGIIWGQNLCTVP